MATDQNSKTRPTPAALLALILLAQSQVAAPLDSADTASTRALAELGLVFTLVATLCAARLAHLPRTAWWFLPLIGLGGSAVLMGLSLRDFDLDTGRSPESAYNEVAGLQTEDAYEFILGMFQDAIEANEKPIDNRFRLLSRGQYVLAGDNRGWACASLRTAWGRIALVKNKPNKVPKPQPQKRSLPSSAGGEHVMIKKGAGGGSSILKK